MSEAGWLAEWLSSYDEGTPVRVTVRFPDLDWEVDDWAFGVSDSLTDPAIVVDVWGADFDYPDVVRRLKALVDFAAYHNFVD
ncbi:MAG: hypothetical protein IKG18_11640 [Atopobiaceae bacterium]|nr:hypothetical protein [Atopobiaceae bacterium]